MYLALVNAFRTTRKYGGEIRPRPPADPMEIAGAEQRLGIRFPPELRELLLEMDGDCNLLLALEEIRTYSACSYSENYPAGSLLFFGADGGGNLFAYKVEEGEAKSGAVYLWDHEMAAWGTREEELSCQATSLAELIRAYYSVCYGELLPE